jgi:HAMP domain-containing protein
MSMNWKSSITEMKNSGMRAAKNLGALWPVASSKSGVNWTVYESYMNQFVQIDKNIILMAIIDGKGNMRAAVINTPLIKDKFSSMKLTEDKYQTAKLIADTPMDDCLKVVGNIKIKEKSIGLAKLVIKFSKYGVYRTQNFMILNTSILAIVILIVGFIGAWYLAKYISTNFNIIVAGMRKVAEGNLDVEVDVKSNDEVGVLADDFNRMIVELKQKVRIKDAFETVADGLKDMEGIKKAYKTFTFQEMTDKMMKGYAPIAGPNDTKAIFIFIDISSLMNYAYDLMSEELKVIIEKLIEKISMTALEYQGAVFKVTEKYILLSFGYPFSHDDDMKRALISTAEIRKELVALVKAKLTLGYNVEDFAVNFIMVGGNVTKNFVDKLTIDKYGVIVDYLNFASKYGGKKQYSTDIYATEDIADGTAKLAMYDRVDSVAMPEGGTVELMKLKGTKF